MTPRSSKVRGVFLLPRRPFPSWGIFNLNCCNKLVALLFKFLVLCYRGWCFLTALLDLCPKVSEQITASRDFDLKIRGRFSSLWNFLTSSNITEEQRCLVWLVLCVVVVFMHLNISNVCFLKRLVLYQYNSGLKREFNWSIVSAHRKVETWRKKGVVSRKR